MSIEDVPSSVSVGDVLLDHPERTEKDEIEIAGQEVRNKYENIVGEHEQRLEELSERHDVDLSTVIQTLDDGDVVLLSRRHRDMRVGESDEEAYGCTEGIVSGSCLVVTYPMALVNCSESAIEPGMVFDILKDEEGPYGLKYNHEKTAEERKKPVFVELVRNKSEILSQVGVSSVDELEPPFYVRIGQFDDGQFYSEIYDSHSEHGQIVSGSTHPVYRVPEEWRSGVAVEVDEIHFGEHDHPYHENPKLPVAVVPQNAELIDVDLM
ncbi:hypothetical protein [Haloarcula argentinensis]|uniref:hypothetical protein n=1 Tax=Haloarcula argentinensis TaxID=43776 RepID=UPI00166CBD09|nr:hypothetical protein [Haloarcula argentinensis]